MTPDEPVPAEVVRALRRRLRLPQRKLAVLMGVHVNTIVQWERAGLSETGYRLSRQLIPWMMQLSSRLRPEHREALNRAIDTDDSVGALRVFFQIESAS